MLESAVASWIAVTDIPCPNDIVASSMSPHFLRFCILPLASPGRSTPTVFSETEVSERVVEFFLSQGFFPFSRRICCLNTLWSRKRSGFRVRARLLSRSGPILCFPFSQSYSVFSSPIFSSSSVARQKHLQRRTGFKGHPYREILSSLLGELAEAVRIKKRTRRPWRVFHLSEDSSGGRLPYPLSFLLYPFQVRFRLCAVCWNPL